MDANKREVLVEIGYKIESCGMCKHSEITPSTDFGVCGLYTYEHLKHAPVANLRQLSINRHGTCLSFEAHAQAAAVVSEGFAEFLS
jgi:hypothetical protein